MHASQTLMLIRDDVLKALEVARNEKGIGKVTRSKSDSVCS